MNLYYSEIAPLEWDRQRIEDVCERVTSGGTPSRKRSDFYGGEVLWVKTKELLDDWIEDTEEKLTLEGLKGSSAKLLKANAVLMAMYGATVGQLGILRHEATCNQAACAMEVDPEKADFRFLFYMLLQHREQIIGMATGAAQQNLNGVTIKNLIVPFPDLNEQKSIADIIATLDDKIALNRKLNETLEGMARALFQSWFVDFDPVKAKLAAVRQGRDPDKACIAALSGKLRIPPGKPKDESLEDQLPSAEELDEAIAALDQLSKDQIHKLSKTASHFPDNFQESELGLIPEGWEVKLLETLAQTITKGTTPKKLT
jgi:type I restriction enzyme S subunit